MGREPVEATILGLKVTSQPLPFPASQEMVPDVGEFITRATRQFGFAIASGISGADDVMKLLPTLDPAAVRSLLETLNKHARKILACTVVVMPDVTGELANHDLSKEKDRTEVFDERPDAFIPIVLFAGRVTFARFFPVLDLKGDSTPTTSS